MWKIISDGGATAPSVLDRPRSTSRAAQSRCHVRHCVTRVHRHATNISNWIPACVQGRADLVMLLLARCFLDVDELHCSPGRCGRGSPAYSSVLVAVHQEKNQHRNHDQNDHTAS